MSLDNIVPPGAAAPVPADAQPAPQAAAPASTAFPSPFADVIAGVLPAVSIPGIEKGTPPDPAQGFVISSLDKLTQAGLDFYEGKDHITVLFNPAKISEDALKKADKDGTLLSIAPPAGAAAPQEGAEPAPQGDAPQGDAPAPLAGASAPAPSAPPASATLTRGRLANVGAVKSNGIKPNPLPAALARRPV